MSELSIHLKKVEKWLNKPKKIDNEIVNKYTIEEN